jgi:hypothetical protein
MNTGHGLSEVKMIKKETGMKNETQISRLNKPFFVFGCERFGTTILRLMLAEHPRLQIPRESNFIPAFMNQLPLDSPLDADPKKLACQIISYELGSQAILKQF